MMGTHLQDRAEENSGRGRRLNRRAWRLPLLIMVCGLGLSDPRPAEALNEDWVEYEVKLACIYNITKFVEWPSNAYRSSRAPLTIGIVGNDPFSRDLEDELRTRKVGGRPIEIKKLRPGDAMSACHVVFIPLTAGDQAAGILQELKGSSTLTIGETEGFTKLGGIINIAVEGNRLRLEVNPRAAERAGVKIGG